MTDIRPAHDAEYLIGASIPPAYTRDVGIFFGAYSPSRDKYFTLRGQWNEEEYSLGEWVPPVMKLTQPLAEQLMTQLWGLGIRPEHWGHEGEVGSLRHHLADMRKLVSKTLQVDL